MLQDLQGVYPLVFYKASTILRLFFFFFFRQRQKLKNPHSSNKWIIYLHGRATWNLTGVLKTKESYSNPYLAGSPMLPTDYSSERNAMWPK